MRRMVNSLKTAWTYVRLFFSLAKGGIQLMATVYVTLIVAGRRDFASVPPPLKDQVKADLTAMGLEELAE